MDLIQERLTRLQLSSGKTKQRFAYMLKWMRYADAYNLEKKYRIRRCLLEGFSETEALQLLNLARDANAQLLLSGLNKWSGQNEV